jgi:hypothetical protein
MKVINSAGPGWHLWRKGWPHPLAKLTTDGEVWTAHPGFTEEAIAWILTAPSALALQDCFLTPAGMRFPEAQHAVNLGVFLDLAVKHRAGLLGDKYGAGGRPRKAHSCPEIKAWRGVWQRPNGSGYLRINPGRERLVVSSTQPTRSARSRRLTHLTMG